MSILPARQPNSRWLLTQCRLFLKTSFFHQVRGEIEHYLLFLSVPAIITFIMAALYFPSKPPTPPSNSAKVNQQFLISHTLLSRKHAFHSFLERFNFWKTQTPGQSLWSGQSLRYGCRSVSTGNLGSRTYPGPLQAVWNNWCALMVISLTKISLEGSSLWSSLWLCQSHPHRQISPNLFTPSTIPRWVSDGEVGLPPRIACSARLHLHCHRSWYCHWTY